MLVFHYLYLILSAITHPRTRPFLTKVILVHRLDCVGDPHPHPDTMLDHQVGVALTGDPDDPVLDPSRVLFQPCRRLLVV